MRYYTRMVLVCAIFGLLAWSVYLSVFGPVFAFSAIWAISGQYALSICVIVTFFACVRHLRYFWPTFRVFIKTAKIDSWVWPECSGFLTTTTRWWWGLFIINSPLHSHRQQSICYPHKGCKPPNFVSTPKSCQTSDITVELKHVHVGNFGVKLHVLFNTQSPKC